MYQHIYICKCVIINILPCVSIWHIHWLEINKSVEKEGADDRYRSNASTFSLGNFQVLLMHNNKTKFYLREGTLNCGRRRTHFSEIVSAQIPNKAWCSFFNATSPCRFKRISAKPVLCYVASSFESHALKVNQEALQWIDYWKIQSNTVDSVTL